MGVPKKRKKKKSPPFPLRQILKQYQWSQYRLARAAGVSDQYVSDLCRGKKFPSWRTLLNLLTTVGANLGDLTPKGGAA